MNIEQEKVKDLKRLMIQTDGYRECYQTSKSNNQKEKVPVYISFNIKNVGFKKYLKSTIESSGGEIVNEYDERQAISSEQRKRTVVHAFIYFATAYVSSIVGVPILSPTFGITFEFIHGVLLGLFPATSAFLTHIIREWNK